MLAQIDLFTFFKKKQDIMNLYANFIISNSK